MSEKIEVLDMLISVLVEHEKKLDALIARLEVVSEMVPVSCMIKKTGTSVGITIPKDISTRYGLMVGDHIHAYLKKA